MKMIATFKMSYTLTIVNRRAAYCSMHIITFLKQKLGKIRTVLSSYTRDKGNFSIFHILDCYIYLNNMLFFTHFNFLHLYI